MSARILSTDEWREERRRIEDQTQQRLNESARLREEAMRRHVESRAPWPLKLLRAWREIWRMWRRGEW